MGFDFDDSDDDGIVDSSEITYDAITTFDHNTLGLIVSKYYGNSVERNLFKRRCRYLFRNMLINQGIDIALIVRPETQNIPFTKINNSFRALYEKISV